MKKTFLSIAMVAVVTVAVLIPCAASSANPALAGENKPAAVEVSIANFTFNAAVLTVPVGTTVKWINRDDIPHTVVSTDRVFASPVLDTDETFSYTFTKRGTYSYYCSIHPKMTAKVVVK